MVRIRGASDRVWQSYERIPPLLVDGPPERAQIVEGGSLHEASCVISDTKFLSSEGVELQKPDYFYGDAIVDRDTVMNRNGSPWLRLVGGRIMFLPAMPQRYSLLQLEQMSVL